MNHFAIDFNWDDPGAVKSPELRATWASLKMAAGGETITRVFSEREKGVRDNIYVSLYPLAEWISENWFFLSDETGGSHRFAHGFDNRHNLLFSGDGFAWPALRIVPTGGFTQLEWSPHRALGGLEFLTRGDFHVASEEIEAALRGLMQSVVHRLEDEGVADTRLQQNWQAIERLDQDESDYCAFVAKTGLDPFAISDELGSRLIRANDAMDPGIVSDVMNLIDVSRLDNALNWIDSASRKVRNEGSRIEHIDVLRQAIADAETTVGQKPWDIGYAAARRARQMFDIGERYIDLATVFGEAVDAPEIADASHVVPVSAMVESGEADAKAILFRDRRHQSPATLRFEACRAAYEAAMATPGHMAVVAPTFSSRQKAARAFAADFLAPAHEMRRLITSPRVSDDDLDMIACAFGVSEQVVVHQIRNHKLAELAN